MTTLLDHETAWEALGRFEDDNGVIRPTHEPEPVLLPSERDAIACLCDEWDYLYAPWPKEPK